MDLQSQQIDALAVHCAEETQRFFRNEKDTSTHCFELLRWALQENVSQAFTHVYRIYESLVHSWVRTYSHFESTGEPSDYFVSAAFAAFYFALRGKKFANFATVGQLMKYLKMCTFSAINQYLRELNGAQLAPTPVEEMTHLAAIPDLSQRVDSRGLWEHLTALFPDEQDQLLIRLYFVYDMKPAAIAAEHPQRWATAREVSVDLQRIRRALRRDEDLINLLDVPL